MQLRPYQTDIIARTEAALKAEGSAVMQMPTGGGKTRIAAEIVSKADGSVWFICHRQEIERQAAAAFARAGIDFGIISPRGIPQYEKRVQIVSVGALPNKIDDLPAPKLAIWDECHHVAAKSWAVIREQLSSTVHLGLTATPERFDGKGLGEWFSALVTGPSTRELIDGGYLSEFRYFAPSDPDLTAAKLQAGDYKKTDAAKVMNTPVLIGDAIAEYKAKASGKRALIFAASIEASKAIVERFNAEGILATHVDGTTPTDERDAAVASLAAGRINVLSNVEVFTEGFDLPAIDAVILMRPTKSVTLFLQMIGRALRKAVGKDEALIFDHAGLWLDHGWFDSPWDWSIEGGVKKRRLAACGEGRLRRCPSCKEVREERVETCRCGYEFPTGRELGEYDGQLWELRAAVPEGFANQYNFAKMQGVSPGTVANWRRAGMPSEGALIPIIPASDWLSENGSTRTFPPRDVGDPENYLSPKDFEQENGLHAGACYYLRKSGLPCAKNGWVHRVFGAAWLVTYRGEGGELSETKRAFADRLGVGEQVVDRWTRHGMPRTKNGGVPSVSAAVWVDQHGVEDISYAKDRSLISNSDFCRLVGVSGSIVKQWKRNGIPCGTRGKIIKSAALTWLRQQDFKYLHPMNVSDPSQYESPTLFSKRTGSTSNAFMWRKRGLPCASNGWVHIQRGLEWVRDNTDTKIPPEAWPRANDNHQAKEEAA